MADKKNDGLDWVALGMGCGVLILAGTIQWIILAALVTNSGVQFSQNPNDIPIELRLVGLLTGLLVNILVGYITATYAEHSKMSHAAIISGAGLLIGFVGIVATPMGQTPVNFLAFLLLVPTTLLGAKRAISRSQDNQQTKL